MKLIRVGLGLAFVSAFFFSQPAVAGIGAAGTNLPPKITFELRDGSRVVGHDTEDFMRFHSPLLGDLKLAVPEIRTVDCLATNSARLTTANGDVLTVWFADAELSAKTSFGTVKLAVDTVRRLSVSTRAAAGTRLSGLVALWPGDDSGRDAVGTNDAELTDIGFADGQVGRAFALNGFSSWIKIPANETLDVGKGDGLTVSAWIKPISVTGFHPIVEWEVTRQKSAVSLWIGHLPQDHGVLLCNLGDDSGQNHMLFSAAGALIENQFQHVALTYDKKSGMGRLFINGQIVAQQNMGIFTPDTTGPLFISRRPCDQPGDWTYNSFFDGLLDEISIFNRALSPTEIQAASLDFAP